MKGKMPPKPNYENWPREKVKVADLFLDPENIRLQVEVKSSQEALINDLFVNEKALQILESIAANGFFPDEIPVVIKEDQKVVVIDGNRRVAALKVLNRPEIVPSMETVVRKLLKNAGKTIKEIEVVVSPNRDAVRRFLASKHTQNTRRPWRPLRQAYFYKAELERGKTVENLRSDYPGVDIDKFLRLINIHKIAKAIQYDSDQVNQKVHNERSFPASTIERLYEDKQIRNFLGFDFDKDGEVRISIKKTEFEKGFKKIIQDVVDKTVDSRALNSETNRKEYLSTFASSEIPKKGRKGKVTTSKDFKEIPPAQNKMRKTLASLDIKFSLQSKGVKRMLIELQGINYHRFPNAAHDLLRSFLECGLKAYFDHNNKKIQPQKGKYVYLDTVLKEFIDEMNGIKNHKLLQVAARIKDNTKMSSYSAQFLNATNHNPDIFVTPREVEDAWEAMEPLFRHILNPGKKQNAKNNP